MLYVLAPFAIAAWLCGLAATLTPLFIYAGLLNQ